LHARGIPPAAEAWLRSWWDFPAHDRFGIGHTISIRPGQPGPASGDAAAAPVTLPGVEMPCRALGDGAWEIGGPGAGVRLRMDERESRIEGWGWEGGVYPALFAAISEVLRAGGLIPLHGAGIVRGGGVTALLALSGTGKSSTLVQALRAGWRPVAEDLMWLDPITLTVYGWDRGVHLWPDARARFAADVEGWEPSPEGKLFLPWRALGVVGPASGRLERIAVLERDAERDSAWEPLPPREGVRALWESMGVPLSPFARDAAAREVPRLLERVETCRLVLGRTALPL
ncbi:MAG TPA: hypothetical protein VFQ45_20090, partial [Longimicrobium sp.]|nr:hypothetical protein [Longimicrobium sp.]